MRSGEYKLLSKCKFVRKPLPYLYCDAMQKHQYHCHDSMIILQ